MFHFINISHQSQSEARLLIPRHVASQMKNTAGLLGQEIILPPLLSGWRRSCSSQRAANTRANPVLQA